MEKTLLESFHWKLAKIEGRRRKGQQRMRWLDGIIYSVNMNVRKLQEIMKNREA